MPTQNWQPIDSVILSSSFTITANDIGITILVSSIQAGLPQPAPGGVQAGVMAMNSFLSTMSPVNTAGGSCGGDRGVGASEPQCFPDPQITAFAAEPQRLPDAASAYAAVNRAAGAAVPSEPRRWSIWSTAYGGTSRMAGATSALDARVAGVVTGLDYHLSRDTLVGFALGGGGTSFGLSGGLGSGKSDMFQAGGYGRHRIGDGYLSAAAAYGRHWMSSDRIEVNGDRLAATFSAHNIGARVESGYRVGTAVVGITPYAALQAQWISTPGFDEAVVTGTNLLAINASASSTSATRTELGTWLDRTIAMVNGGLTLRGRAAWAHDAQRGGTIGAAFQLAPAVSLVLRNIDPPADLALVSAAAELRWGDRWSMTAQFDSEFSNSSQTYVGTGSARYRW